LAQSIAACVDAALDDAAIGPIQKRVFGIVTAGLFFDVIDFIILGSLVPDMVRSNSAAPAQIGTVGTAQIIGLFTGAIRRGEFTYRLGSWRSAKPDRGATSFPHRAPVSSTSGGAERNGVPLLPVRDTGVIVTLDIVNALRDELP
jgi:hypothetical protein